ncbi:MAG: hypothetical protein IJY24_00525 [Clostridia bacterium]|nr:hypothetical protein [Clostridia bacterium]
MTTESFLQGYFDFLLDAAFSLNSANQYKSYLKNVCKKLPGMAKHLELISEYSDPDIQAVYAEQMNSAVSSAISSGTSAVSTKQLRNYKSAVALLIAYISNLEWTKGKGGSPKITITAASEYDRRDLRRIFLSRVKTQDRFSYSYGVFAARILSKIASKHKIKLFDGMVNGVSFIISADGKQRVTLADIDKLTIATDGGVYVEVKGASYPLYTEAIEDGVSRGFKILTARSMRDLSLDHDIPLYHALKDALFAMPEYKKLSDSVRSYIDSGITGNASTISKRYLAVIYPTMSLNEVMLLGEVFAFLNSTAITVMYTPSNSSKNKNVI